MLSDIRTQVMNLFCVIEVIKKYLITDLCKEGRQKPTGKSSPSPVLDRAMNVYAKIKARQRAAVYGGSTNIFD